MARAQVRVADQLEERPQPQRVVAVDAHRRDLDLVGHVAMVVAVDLGIERQRPLRDVADALLVRLVDSARPLGRHLFRGRPARRALERAVDLIAPSRARARVGLEAEPGRDDDAEPGAAPDLDHHLAGPRVRAAVRRCDDDAGPAHLPRDLARELREVRQHAGGRAARQDERSDRQASRPPESPARAHSHHRGSATATSGSRPCPGRSPGLGRTKRAWALPRARGAPRARASARPS